MESNNVETLKALIAVKVIQLNQTFHPELSVTEFLSVVEDDLKLDGTDPIKGPEKYPDAFISAEEEQITDPGSEYDQMAYDMPF